MGLTRDRAEGNSGWPGTQEVLTELRQIAEGRLCRPEQRQAVPGRTRGLCGLGLPGLRRVPPAGSRVALDLAPDVFAPSEKSRISHSGPMT
jgi:hypothetical protein